jgi:hypothetical protein
LTLQLFVPKKQEARGYIQWVQFLQNYTRCTQRKRTQRTSRQKDPLAFCAK